MQHLNVSVISTGTPLALPVEIYTPGGTLIGSGAVSSRREKSFTLPLPGKAETSRRFHRVYVLAKLPSGATVQEVAELDAEGGRVVLDATRNSPHQWLEWVTPFRSLQHLSSEQANGPTGFSVGASRRIGKVWATLWEFREQRWEATNVRFESRRGNRGIRQLTIDVPPRPHLLQLGGEELAWRLVSLPPGDQVKIALTPSAKEDGGDAIDITVGRQHPDNDLIMSYLSRGALPEASRLAELMKVADRLLYEKFEDPISAVAAAYVLFKTNQLERREDWLRNLARNFSHIADIKIVQAALAREQDGIAEKDIRRMLLDAMNLGLPIFSLGMTLLLESMAAMHRGERESRQFHRAYLAAQAYARGRCSKGAYLAFYGKSPAEPLWSPIFGTEQKGAATPVSQGSSPPVFMRRPKGSPLSVKYGPTVVTLPRAPVSELMLELSSEPLRIPRRISEPNHWLRLDDLSQPIREQTRWVNDFAVPSVEISNLPDYLAVQENETESAARGGSGFGGGRFDELLQLPHVQKEAMAKRKPRQTLSYWQAARVSHSIPIMDEDE